MDELLLVRSGKLTTAYNRGKLLASIIRVLLPVSDDLSNAYWLVKTVEHKLIAVQRDNKQWEPITSEMLSELVYDTLLPYNQAAGLSYAVAKRLISTNQKGRRGRPRQY